jgi:hypothetical protein
VTAARLVRQFSALLDAVAAGELHLTGLLMLGPHLTRDNHLDVLARAKHRTKKELAKLARECADATPPVLSAPARIAEPAESAPARMAVPLRYKVQFRATEDTSSSSNARRRCSPISTGTTNT